MKQLQVADIVSGTSVDGPGLRTAIYFAGCAHRCPGCHNPSTWDFASGRRMSEEEIAGVAEENGNNVTFTGGDPMYQAEGIAELARRLRRLGYRLWCYTGFLYEDLLGEDSPAGARELLAELDVLVDGPYIEALRDTDLMFRGSSNQRIIDVPASLRAGKAVLHRLNAGPELPEF